MERNNIEKAAKHYQEKDHDIWTGKGMATELQKAFITGAEWRINSVWHNAITDIPEAYFPVLVEDDLEDFEVSMLALVEECPKNWRSWAYIEDLIPNKED